MDEKAERGDGYWDESDLNSKYGPISKIGETMFWLGPQKKWAKSYYEQSMKPVSWPTMTYSTYAKPKQPEWVVTQKELPDGTIEKTYSTLDPISGLLYINQVLDTKDGSFLKALNKINLSKLK